MKIIVKDPGTGETVTLVAPVVLCGSRADFVDLYNHIGNFFGWPGANGMIWSPKGYAEIEIHDHRPTSQLQAAPTRAYVATNGEDLPLPFRSEALGAGDTPSQAPPGEPRLTPGSGPDEIDIPF